VSLIYLLGTVFSMCPGWGESAGKPGSVVDSHSSGRCVTAGLKQPTREPCGPHASSPIWSCSRWGLPCHACYQPRGALLPHHFTLTCTARKQPGGIFSVALSMGSRPPGITWHLALWSPDFPPETGTNPDFQRLSGRLLVTIIGQYRGNNTQKQALPHPLFVAGPACSPLAQ
jgi:hypothetical protein